VLDWLTKKKQRREAAAPPGLVGLESDSRAYYEQYRRNYEAKSRSKKLGFRRNELAWSSVGA